MDCHHEGEIRGFLELHRLPKDSDCAWAAHAYVVGQKHPEIIVVSEYAHEAADAALSFLTVAAEDNDALLEEAGWNDYLNANGFAKWLLERVGEEEIKRARGFSPTFARRMHHCRKAASTCVIELDTADRILIECFPDVGFWEIPEDLYRDTRPRPRMTAEDRRQILDRVENGETPYDVACELGISVDSITKWRQREKVAA